PLHQNIFELLIMLDALKSASAARVTAVIPYFPYVRSDKKDRPRISITARLMADLITAAGADRVLTMDLHAAQIQGFFRCPADQLQAINLMCDHLKRRDLTDAVLVASDAGEAKDVARYTNRLDLPMAIIDKRRDRDDEDPRAAHIIGDIKGRSCILVDDEIASGGTLLRATELLLERGARDVCGVATHAVLSGRALERIQTSPISEVIVTDTIPIPEGKRIDKLKVISVARMLADAIRSIHDGTSVSALFR
ncbi:MAG TPA: ribose-phosphate diphosphokinase, partial [Polyangiaceae bacterium]|nr:ribose-phosphate diphosphokinase [Polyangiaceae bacterium]